MHTYMLVDARAKHNFGKERFSGVPSRGLKKGRQNIQAKKIYSPALAYFLRLAARSFVMI